MKFTNDPGKVISDIIESNSYPSIFVLTDSNTSENCLPVLNQNLAKFNIKKMSVSAGENTKNIDTCILLWDELSKQGADRHSLLINLGGGMITDLGGFVASTYKRGINFINVPTSMLAMIDASIGGKNGVNLNGVKNQIGVIKQPQEVIVSPVFLQTLDRRNYLSGYAEALKHGILDDFDAYEKTLGFARPDYRSEAFSDFLKENIAIKERIVNLDPEEKADRKALNFGHTVGHALETFSQKTDKPMLHGEAVAWGMLAEMMLSNELLYFPQKLVDKYRHLILKHYLKPQIDGSDYAQLIDFMKKDKKNYGKNINFTLLKAPGIYHIDQNVAEEKILTVLANFV